MKIKPTALLRVLKNLYRGIEPQPELPWTAADYFWLGVIGLVLATVIILKP
jgi:hypothetical protein